MVKDKSMKAPVTERALIQRVNRSLAKGGETLHWSRPWSCYVRVELPARVVERDVDPEKLARKLGALQEWEALQVVVEMWMTEDDAIGLSFPERFKPRKPELERLLARKLPNGSQAMHATEIKKLIVVPLEEVLKAPVELRGKGHAFHIKMRVVDFYEGW